MRVQQLLGVGEEKGLVQLLMELMLQARQEQVEQMEEMEVVGELLQQQEQQELLREEPVEDLEISH